MMQTKPTEGRYLRNSATPSKTDSVAAAPGKAKLPLPVLLYLLTAVAPIWFDLGSLNMSTMRVLLIITILPTMKGVFSANYGPVLLTDLAFLLYIIWASAAMAINTPSHAFEFAGSFIIEFLGGYFLARAYIRNAFDFLALCRWFSLTIIASIPFAIIESKTGHPVVLDLIRGLPGINTFGESNTDPRWGLYRVQFVFAHPIHYGLYCSMGFSLSLISMKGFFSKRFRLLAVISSLSGVFLSLSSGAYFSIIMQVILVIWAFIFRLLRARWLILLAVILACYLIIDMISSRTPMRVFMSYATFSAETAYWRGLIFDYGMKSVWSNPLFGVGLNNWERPSFMESSSMDNFWLLEAVRYGIPGFLFLFTGYFWALWRIGRFDFDRNKMLWNLRRGWSFTFVGLSVTLSTVAIWSSLYSVTFFMFGAGMWMLDPYSREGGILQFGAILGDSTSTPNRPGARPPFTRFANAVRRG